MEEGDTNNARDIVYTYLRTEFEKDQIPEVVDFSDIANELDDILETGYSGDCL